MLKKVMSSCSRRRRSFAYHPSDKIAIKVVRRNIAYEADTEPAWAKSTFGFCSVGPKSSIANLPARG